MINIRPITFRWTEWTSRFRSGQERILAAGRAAPEANRAAVLLKEASTWTADMYGWLTSLSDDQKKDIPELLQAEADMLFELLDPGHPPFHRAKPDSDEAMQFRERWYEALPLLQFAKRLDLPNAEGARLRFERLEEKALEREWLP